MLRKINGIFALLSTAVLIFHIIYTVTCTLCGRHNISTVPLIAITVGAICIHAVLSILATVISARRDGNGAGKYPKIHGKTIGQRLSGFLCIFLAIAHILTMANISGPTSLRLALIPLLAIILIALYHLRLSFAKVFVTLGIVINEKAIRALEIIGSIVCAALAIYAIIMVVHTFISLM